MVWEKLPQHYSNIALNAFVVMPNHIHGIIEITHAVGAGFKPAPTPPEPANNIVVGIQKQHPLSEIVRALKTFSARQINELRNMQGVKLWQRNYYEHIIRNGRSYRHIADYIENNPTSWQKDQFFTQ
jgi:REP element-mobilizing transposase RayT